MKICNGDNKSPGDRLPPLKRVRISLMGVFALVYLIGYLALTFYLCSEFIQGESMNNDAMNLVFAIFGALSAKLNTVTDFIFGASMPPDNNNQPIEPKDPKQ